MKRVAFVLTFGKSDKDLKYLGGAERRLSSIFTGIHNDDLDVTVIYLLGANKESVWKLLSKYCDKRANIKFISSNFKLFKHLVRSRYDYVCYTDCVAQTFSAIWGAFLGGSKRVMLIESARRAKGVFLSKPEKFIMYFNYRFSTHLDTLYPSSKDFLERKYGTEKRKVTVTPCSLPRIENYFSRVEKENIILFSGRLYHAKNPDLFVSSAISCAEQLRRRGYQCYICGEGELRVALSKTVSDAGCDDIIKVMGYQNMEEITPKCKVFCSLQDVDNYPSQSLLEAVTAGCWCICTEFGNTSTIVNPSFGELIPKDKDALSAALNRVLDFDDEKWADIHDAAERFAQDKFHINTAVHHYENMFLEQGKKK